MKHRSLALCAFLIALLNPLASGQESDARFAAILDSVRLPAAFRARVFLYSDSPEPSQQIDFESADEWCVATLSLPQPDLGFIPSEYIHYALTESWRYDFSRRVAARSNVFGQLQHCPVEGLCSPRDVLRTLRRVETSVNRIVEQSAGVFEITVSPPGPKTTWIVTIDSGRGELLRKRVLAPSGDVSSDIKYENWCELPAGGKIPTQVYHSMRGAVAGDPRLEYSAILTEIASTDSAGPPARLRLAPDLTIADEIDSVSRRAEGTVLGRMGQDETLTGLRSSRPSGVSGLTSRVVVLVGVGLILMAGIIVGFRRWKGA